MFHRVPFHNDRYVRFLIIPFWNYSLLYPVLIIAMNIPRLIQPNIIQKMLTLLNSCWTLTPQEYFRHRKKAFNEKSNILVQQNRFLTLSVDYIARHGSRKTPMSSFSKFPIFLSALQSIFIYFISASCFLTPS